MRGSAWPTFIISSTTWILPICNHRPRSEPASSGRGRAGSNTRTAWRIRETRYRFADIGDAAGGRHVLVPPQDSSWTLLPGTSSWCYQSSGGINSSVADVPEEWREGHELASLGMRTHANVRAVCRIVYPTRRGWFLAKSPFTQKPVAIRQDTRLLSTERIAGSRRSGARGQTGACEYLPSIGTNQHMMVGSERRSLRSS